MIDKTHRLPITRQAEILELSRSGVYTVPRPVPDAHLALMRQMGLTALYRGRNTSTRHPAHPVYPYLLRNLTIDRPNHAWAMDITYCTPRHQRSPPLSR